MSYWISTKKKKKVSGYNLNSVEKDEVYICALFFCSHSGFDIQPYSFEL